MDNKVSVGIFSWNIGNNTNMAKTQEVVETVFQIQEQNGRQMPEVLVFGFQELPRRRSALTNNYTHRQIKMGHVPAANNVK